MITVTLEDVQLLEFERIEDARGNLSFFENHHQIPFTIKRVEYFYDIPGGKGFKGYAYKSRKELIVALSGSFDVIIDNGMERKCITLNRSYVGLYIPPGVWRQVKNFSTNSLALIATDDLYNETDYIRSLKEFIHLKDE